VDCDNARKWRELWSLESGVWSPSRCPQPGTRLFPYNLQPRFNPWPGLKTLVISAPAPVRCNLGQMLLPRQPRDPKLPSPISKVVEEIRCPPTCSVSRTAGTIGRSTRNSSTNPGERAPSGAGAGAWSPGLLASSDRVARYGALALKSPATVMTKGETMSVSSQVRSMPHATAAGP
jgi:hypothetical protein